MAQVESQRSSKHRPVFFIPATQAFPGIFFVELVHLAIDRLDKILQILKRCRFVRTRLTSLHEQSRQVSLGIGIGNIWRIEADATQPVFFKNLANATPQYRPNQDVGVEDKHLSGQQPSRGGASA